jgi:CRISPR-associated protein Csm5
MKKYYQLNLTLGSELFIGSGEIIRRHELFLINGFFHVLDEEKLTHFVIKHDLWREFENYIQQISNPNLPNHRKDILRWMEDNQFSESEMKSIIKYSILDRTGDSRINEIKAFIKDAYGNCYIPGSSIKGFLHTCVMVKMLHDNMKDKQEVSRSLKDIERRGLLLPPEFNQNLKKKMTAIQVSDSKSIPSASLILSRVKYCNIKNGNISTTRIPSNIEFLRRGTKTQVRLTLDESEINMPYLLAAIESFHSLYQQHYSSRFASKYQIEQPNSKQFLRLGAFTNFAVKTINYAILGQEAIKVNSSLLQKRFRESKNINGIQYGVSPMCLKTSDSHGKLSENGIVYFDYREMK